MVTVPLVHQNCLVEQTPLWSGVSAAMEEVSRNVSLHR